MFVTKQKHISQCCYLITSQSFYKEKETIALYNYKSLFGLSSLRNAANQRTVIAQTLCISNFTCRLGKEDLARCRDDWLSLFDFFCVSRSI